MKMKQKKLQILYCLLQGLFWMLFCVGVGYINAYLTGRGLQPGRIGVIIAAFGAISALVQPSLGKLADESERLGWKPLLFLLLGLCLLSYAGQLLFHSTFVSGLTCGMILLLLNAMMPFVNGVAFYYEKSGYVLNFGWARGCGSLLYSVISLLLGQWVAKLGVGSITITGIVITVILLFLLWLMPYQKEQKRGTEAGPEAGTGQKKGFLKKYPGFLEMLLGFLLLLMFHNITNTYMLQMMESVGGGTAQMGAVFALAGVLELPVMFGIVFIIQKIDARHLLVVSGIAFVLKAITYLLAQSVAMLFVAQFFQIFSYALFASVSVYYSNEVMKKEDKLKGQSLVGSSITLGAVCGNLSGGLLIQNYGLRTMLWAAFFIAAAGTAIICFCSLRSQKHTKSIKKE